MWALDADHSTLGSCQAQHNGSATWPLPESARRPIIGRAKLERGLEMHDTGNPWKTKESRTVYKNPWISVREDQVVRPDGQDGIYGVVEFKNWAIGIVPVTENGDTFLVGQHRY